jgi:serine/threonine-protein kinase
VGTVVKLGRYEVVRHFASGGMAHVLLARTTGIGGFERYVVVKRILSEHAKDERFVRMFLDEARFAAMLHHGNIVQVHEVGEDAGTIFFAMEYVHGEDVRRLLTELTRRREKTPLEHVITIVSATADALHHAHEQLGPDGKPLGLVHRDVTPANIIVGYDGIVKVVDFGIAKAAIRSSETQAGMLKGKVAYMAPEQCIGQEVDRRSDVFALGVVLYELACVRRLFKGDNDFLTMTAIVQGKIPPPSQSRTDLPKGLEHIIMKALSKRPEDRYQTAAEMGVALEQFANAVGLRMSTKSLAAFMKQKFGTRPEPWLVENAEAEISLNVDFDGEAKGLVAMPASAAEALAIPQAIASTPSAPIMRARKKAITAQQKPSTSPFRPKRPSQLHNAPSLPGLPPARPSETLRAAAPMRDEPSIQLAPDLAAAAVVMAGPVPPVIDDGWAADDKEVTPSLVPVPAAFAEGSASGTAGEPVPVSESSASLVAVPMPRAPRTPLLRDRRVQIGAGAGVLALIAVFVATRSGGKAAAPPPAAPAPVTAPAPAPDPAATPAPPASGSAAASAAAPAPAKKPPAHPAKPAPAKKGKRPKPKMLFN